MAQKVESDGVLSSSLVVDTPWWERWKKNEGTWKLLFL